MDTDIAEYVKHCKVCTMHKARQAIEPMLPRDIPEGPWQDPAADFFDHIVISFSFGINSYITYSTQCVNSDILIMQCLQITIYFSYFLKSICNILKLTL